MPTKICYKELPEHEYVHVIDPSEAIWEIPEHRRGQISFVANGRTFQPSEWAYVEGEELYDAVYHISSFPYTIFEPNDPIGEIPEEAYADIVITEEVE